VNGCDGCVATVTGFIHGLNLWMLEIDTSLKVSNGEGPFNFIGPMEWGSQTLVFMQKEENALLPPPPHPHPSLLVSI
jgi:hypothetical protein